MSELYRYGIYEKALFKKPLPQLLEDAARAGFDNFELSLDETDERLGRMDWDWAERSSFRQTARDCGVQVYSTCFSGQRRFPMGTMDDEKRAYSLRLMERAIQFCVDTGIRVLQVAGYDVYYEKSSAETAKRYDEGLALSARMAERYGVLLGVEPVELYVTSVHKAMELVRAIACLPRRGQPGHRRAGPGSGNPPGRWTHGGPSHPGRHALHLLQPAHRNGNPGFRRTVCSAAGTGIPAPHPGGAVVSGRSRRSNRHPGSPALFEKEGNVGQGISSERRFLT